jgi:hypothetical protein
VWWRSAAQHDSRSPPALAIVIQCYRVPVSVRSVKLQRVSQKRESDGRGCVVAGLDHHSGVSGGTEIMLNLQPTLSARTGLSEPADVLCPEAPPP